MKQEEKTFDRVFLLNGARFKKLNAACHRAVAISKLFKQYANKIEIFGFSDDGNECGTLYGFDFYTFKYPSNNKEWANYCFSTSFYRPLLEKLTSEDLLIINNSIPSFVVKKIIRFCKKKNVRFILDVDEWYAYKIEGLIKSFFKNISTWYHMNVLCKKEFNYIVSTTFLKKHCNKSENVFVFPALVTEKIATIDNTTIPFDKRTITLFFGGFFSKKEQKESFDGIFEAIDEINAIQNDIVFKMIIAGQTGNDTNYVSFLGPLPYNECISKLIESNFSIIPRSKTRTNEAGFPTKLSESFLYGVPCISTDTSDIKKYIIEGINGFVIKDNTKESYLDVFKKILNQHLLFCDFKKEVKRNVKQNNYLVIDHFVDDFKVFVRNI